MDEQFLPFVIIGGIIALVATLIAVGYYFEKKRTEAIGKLAEELGFEFLPKGDADLMADMQGFHLFGQGHSREMKNLLLGRAGELEISIFDYKYVVGHGKHRHVHQQSVFTARADDMDLPQFTMRPETIWHKIGSLLGYKDINFDSHPKFSKKYLLKGPDEDAIRDVFVPEVLEYFEDHLNVNVEADGDLLVYYRYSRLDPKKIRDFMAEGFEVLKLFRVSEA